MPMSLPQPNSQSTVDSSPQRTTLSSPADEATRQQSPSQEFSPAERALLLRLAHDSISSTLQNQKINLDPPTAHFAEPRGAFTSLYLRGELRGCVGYVLPSCTVYRAVAETARAAAFDDNRFAPVTLDEAPRLEIELSILSPAQPVRADEIEVGRHGLVVSQHGRRGLLLPQVPVERGWDRTTFLEQTCRKAGLPLDAWKQGAALEAFTAEVFGEKKIENGHCSK
jgi:AmmeMemoRadiSam system protein A